VTLKQDKDYIVSGHVSILEGWAGEGVFPMDHWNIALMLPGG
jgi:hypothetical protein